MPLTNIADLEVLQMIDDAVGSVTDAFLQRVAGGFDPAKDSEKALGTLHDAMARRLYCAARVFAAKAATVAGEATLADSEIDGLRLIQEAHRYKDVAELVKSIFWACAAQETGEWEKSLGVRANWMIVVSAPMDNPLARIFKGIGSMPGDL